MIRPALRRLVVEWRARVDVAPGDEHERGLPLGEILDRLLEPAARGGVDPGRGHGAARRGISRHDERAIRVARPVGEAPQRGERSFIVIGGRIARGEVGEDGLDRAATRRIGLDEGREIVVHRIGPGVGDLLASRRRGRVGASKEPAGIRAREVGAERGSQDCGEIGALGDLEIAGVVEGFVIAHRGARR